MKSPASLFRGLTLKVRPDYLLGPHTTFKIGGPAQYMVNVNDAQALCDLIGRLNGEGVPFRVLGGGSNILVDDAGISGAVISMGGRLKEIYIREGLLEVGAGLRLPALLRETADLGFSGLEHLAGIPGTAGGAVRMNAGGRERAIGDAVQSVTCVLNAGQLETIPRNACGFGYRTSAFADKIVLSASLKLDEEDRKVIVENMAKVLAAKKLSQPLGSLSAGCVFKNPPAAKSAGQLIQEAGLVGESVGGAFVSAKHANYIINREGAAFDDVLGLIEKVRSRVQDVFAVRLELEIEIWSDRESLRKS